MPANQSGWRAPALHERPVHSSMTAADAEAQKAEVEEKKLSNTCLWYGTIPGSFTEDDVIQELAAYKVHPWKMIVRQHQTNPEVTTVFQRSIGSVD